MSHTFEGDHATFIYDPDMSGLVEIVTEKGKLNVLGSDLLSFFAQ